MGRPSFFVCFFTKSNYKTRGEDCYRPEQSEPRVQCSHFIVFSFCQHLSHKTVIEQLAALPPYSLRCNNMIMFVWMLFRSYFYFLKPFRRASCVRGCFGFYDNVGLGVSQPPFWWYLYSLLTRTRYISIHHVLPLSAFCT